MKSLVIIVIFALFIFFDVRNLILKNKWGEIVVVLVLYSIGFTLCFLLVKGVKIPNPRKGIMYIIKLITFL